MGRISRSLCFIDSTASPTKCTMPSPTMSRPRKARQTRTKASKTRATLTPKRIRPSYLTRAQSKATLKRKKKWKCCASASTKVTICWPPVTQMETFRCFFTVTLLASAIAKLEQKIRNVLNDSLLTYFRVCLLKARSTAQHRTKSNNKKIIIMCTICP